MQKLIIFLTAWFLLASCAGPEQPEKPATPAYKLAVIDNVYDSTDIKAVRINVLLNRLAAKYAEPTDTIAEYTFKAQSVLKNEGIETTCLNILEEISKADRPENLTYKEAATLYLFVNR